MRVNKALEGSDMVLGAAWASVPRHNELLHHEPSILEGLCSYLRLQMQLRKSIGRGGKQVRLVQLRPHICPNRWLPWPYLCALRT